MSAFLGPIHFRVYRKILIQEALTKAIADYAVNEGAITADRATSFLRDEDRPLDEIIDTSNIHGWLLVHIERAETAYAALVTELIKQDASHMEKFKEIAFSLGKEYAIEEVTPKMALYRELDGALLNGMPCDGGWRVIDQSEDNFSWEEIDLHSSFWDEAGGDVKNFYDIRESLIEGVMFNTRWTAVLKENGVYTFMEKS